MPAFNEINKYFQEIQRSYHDINRLNQEIETLKKDPKNEKIINAKLATIDKANQKIQDNEKYLSSLVESRKEQIQAILTQIRKDEDVQVTDEKGLPSESITSSVPLPSEARQYGSFFDENTYRALLPYCQLAYSFEQNGTPEEHALKLAVLFGDITTALDYLKDKNSVHDACLFVLPDVKQCDFSTWRKLAKKHCHEPFILNLLPQAVEIEEAMRSPLPSASSQKTVVDSLIKEIRALKKEWKTYATDEKIRKANEARFQEVSGLLLEKNSLLAEESSGIKLTENIDLLILEAFRELFISESSEAYQYMLKKGLSKKDYSKFLALDKTQAGVNIPDIMIDGASIGISGFYMKKIPVQNEAEAARAACLGKLTNCCQSLSRELGEPCTIHGLTSPNGGFYIICKGDTNHPKISDEVVAQSWVWRSQTNAIVFDSVEISKSIKHDEKSKEQVNTFYQHLSKDLVNKRYTHKVACGGSSGMSDKITGVKGFAVKGEIFVDYSGYCDSQSQKTLIDINEPYLFYDIDVNAQAATKEIIENALNAKKPLLQSHSFMNLLNYALLNLKQDLLELAEKQAKEKNRWDEMSNIIGAMRTYITIDFWQRGAEKSIKAVLENPHLYPNVQNSSGTTPLFLAVEMSDKDLALSLITAGANLEARDNDGMTPLLLAARDGCTETALSLIKARANLEARDNDGMTPLLLAARDGRTETALSLIKARANLEARDNDGMTPLQLAAQDGHTETALSLIRVGANLEARDEDGWTPLTWAVLKVHIETVLSLITAGANLEAGDNDGMTPLLLAARDGRIEIALLLIKAGANLEAKDKDNQTPLLLAVIIGCRDIALSLIEYGANLEELDNENVADKYSQLPKIQREFLIKNEGPNLFVIPQIKMNPTDKDFPTFVQLREKYVASEKELDELHKELEDINKYINEAQDRKSLEEYEKQLDEKLKQIESVWLKTLNISKEKSPVEEEMYSLVIINASVRELKKRYSDMIQCSDQIKASLSAQKSLLESKTQTLSASSEEKRLPGFKHFVSSSTKETILKTSAAHKEHALKPPLRQK